MRHDIRAGTPVPPVDLVPDEITLLRFGAVTRNTHRIHYDTAFARSEGLDGPVVMAQLHGCLFYRAAAGFAGGEVDVLSVGWQNRSPAYAGERLVVSGVVASVDAATGEITLALEEHRGDAPGTLCCRGQATLTLR
ncbi:acyl dehydratase [Actinomadura sp. KC345]|uniref:acyl dehydratase n=1 Tax=Actinomadura sp. KC345 TaxID=2530371 RepID=UPI001051F759|nr:acyl dehydratase [Actinomadura sp. KC345]TDC46541.1 acyl dehydratase [Actinomadura sp. KC345]